MRAEALILVAVVAATAAGRPQPSRYRRSLGTAATDTRRPRSEPRSTSARDRAGHRRTGAAGSNQIAIALHDPDTHEQLEPRDPPTLVHAHRAISGRSDSTLTRRVTGLATDADLPVAGEWQLRLTVRLDAYRKPIGVAVIEITES